MALSKTNAMRMLDAKKVSYEIMTYSNNDGQIDGITVANKIGKPIEMVYKTLVTQGQNKGIYVFVIPVASELDLKKAAKVAGEKKLDMLPVKEIQKWTGYIRGGCSPIGMKKLYPTFLDAGAVTLETIIVSAGKIGMQLELSVRNLQEMIEAVIRDVIKDV